MSADLRFDHYPASGFADRQAIYFQSGANTLFGWLHLPARSSGKNLGLVICAPFGYEAICAHRGIRTIAESARDSGIPALRFDYAGTGDSSELPADSNQLSAWTGDIVAAVNELRLRTGVEQVCLLGVRLGATLVSLAAERCVGVAGIILMAPIVQGRRYVRELKVRRLASVGSQRASQSSQASDSLDVSGFSLSAATIAALEAVDLNQSESLVQTAAEVLIIDPPDFPASVAWWNLLQSRGVTGSLHMLGGLVEMTMTAPQFAKVPREMLAASMDCVTRCAARQQVPGAEMRVTSGPSGILSPDSMSMNGSMLERAVTFGSNVALFGVVTEPPRGETRRRAVIFLNAGADYHIGAGGLYVALARRWATRGYVVLRMDFAGIGDSATRPGNHDDEVFPRNAMDDVRDAVEFLQKTYHAGEISLAGLCSGAYHALRAAASALPVSRILMINPQNYFWTEGNTVNDMQVAELVRNPGLYREQMFSLAVWKRLLLGRVDVGYISRILLKRIFLALEMNLRDFARWLHLRLPRDLGREIEQITARGVQIVFLFARGEPGIELLKIQGGSSVRRVGERCRIHYFDDADHVFSQRGPRLALEKVLSDELYVRNEWLFRSQAKLKSGP